MNLNNLAAVEQAKGNMAETERLFRSCLALKEKLLGPAHPDVAITANNLAVLLAGENRWDEAEALLRRAIDVLEQAVPPGHPKLTASRAIYLSVTSRRMGGWRSGGG